MTEASAGEHEQERHNQGRGEFSGENPPRFLFFQKTPKPGLLCFRQAWSV